MLRSSPAIRILSEGAPALTIVLLLLLPVALPNRSVIDERVLVHLERVKAAMDRVPYTMGSWVGTKMEVPAVAFTLLHPNAIFCRRYDRLPDGPSISVVMVHCSDLRDMRGHYPPNCYPSSGWDEDASTGGRGRLTTIRLGGRDAAVREYRYSRRLEHGTQTELRILSFFVLPDGTLSSEMDDIYEQSERLAVSVQGACQVQVLIPPWVPEDAAREAASEVLAGMDELFRVLTRAEEGADG
jgi:hypothetical protein